MPKTVCPATLMDDGIDPVDVRKGLREIGFSDIYIIPDSDSLLDETIEKKERDLTRSMEMMEADSEIFLKSIKDRKSNHGF